MAKSLSPKSRVIREAIVRSPDLGPRALAQLINSDEAREVDRVRVTPNEVAQQQLAMQKPGAAVPPPPPPPAAVEEEPEEHMPTPEPGPRRAARPRAARPPKETPSVNEPKETPAARPPKERAAKPPKEPAASRSHSAIELIDRVFVLADECGGLVELKRLVDRLAALRGR